MEKVLKHKAVFISDLHLGTKGCKANLLEDFLKKIECENLYLVGDIIDGWQLRRKWLMTQQHVNIIHLILKKAKAVTNVFWVIGNHDEFMRDFIKHDITFGNIKISNEFVYEHGDKRYLVTHGDMFDQVTRHYKWLSHLGDWAYTHLLTLNDWYNRIRHKFGFDYWSLSQFIKHQVKEAVNFISSFEQHLENYAKKRKFDGVICGHIHKAIIKKDNEFLYMNTGDWVESCSYIIDDGKTIFLSFWGNNEKN